MTERTRQADGHVLTDDDGFTLTRYIKEEPRMYAEARFTFRPVRAIARAKVIDKRRGLDEEQATLALAKTAVSRITEWNLRGVNGEQLPRTPEAFLTIHPVLQNRIAGIVVYSSEGGDFDPLETRLTEQLDDVPNLLDDEDGQGVVDRSQKN